MTEKTKTTKAELYKMLAEAVRNTQLLEAENAATLVDVGAEPRRRRQSRKHQSIPKKPANSKALRPPAGRGKKPQTRRRSR